MSIEIMSAVWRTEIPTHTLKLVLLSLADNASDQGICCPSLVSVAKRCSLTRKGVIEQIQKLESIGHLKVAKGGGRKTNSYTITVKSNPFNHQIEQSPIVTPAVTRSDPSSHYGSPQQSPIVTPAVTTVHPSNKDGSGHASNENTDGCGHKKGSELDQREVLPLVYHWNNPLYPSHQLQQPDQIKLSPTPPTPPRGFLGGKREVVKTNQVPIPAWMESEPFQLAWAEWKQHRKEKQKALTPLSEKKQLKALAELGEVRAIAAIEHSIRNGYQGIFEPKESQDKPKESGHGHIEIYKI